MLEEKYSTSGLVQGIEGKVTAELFDATNGKLVQREETHNFIAKPAVDFLEQAQRTVFKKGMYTLNSSVMKDYQLLDKQNSILVLTDLAAAEDPENETHFYGKPIGWASRTAYSGSDILRGTVNIAQSNATSTQCTWVFDWPTTAANGVIRSVGWARGWPGVSFRSGQYEGNREYASSSIVQALYAGILSKAICRGPNSNFFTSDGYNGTVQQLNGSFQQMGSFPISSVGISTAPYHYVRGLAWDVNTNALWVLGTGGKIVALDSSGTVVVSPISLGITATSGEFRDLFHGLAYDGQYLWVGDNRGITTSGNTTVAKLWQIDPANGSVVNSFTFSYPPATSGGGIYDISYDPERSILWVSALGYGTYGSINPGAGIRGFSLDGEPAALSVMGLCESAAVQRNITSPNYSDISNHMPSSGTDTYDDYGGYLLSAIYNQSYNGCEYIGNNTFLLGSSDFGLAVIKANGLGSRALLSSPIAKTDTQTLRITYQVSFS